MTRSFGRVTALFACSVWLSVAAPALAQTGELLFIRGGTLIDPARDDLGVKGTLVVQNGLIIAVRPGDDSPPLPGARIIDADGGFVMPGISDMHNHLRTGMFRPSDDQARVLRSLLDWGVTTTFDPGVEIDEFDALRNEVAGNRRAYPRTFLIRGVFTTEGGWGKGYTPTTAADARRLVRELKAAGSDGVKLMYDDMRWATTRPFPVMEREIAAAIIDEAHRQGLRAYAHAPILELAKHLLEAGVDCLVHGIVNEPVDAEFIDLMKRNNTCYISTLTMFQTSAGYDAWATRLEAFDIDKRLNPAAMEMFHKAPSGTPRLDNTAWAAERLPVLRLNLFTVHGAGIPVLIGTDTGIPGVLPGISTQLELVMHQEAGLDPVDVLLAATSAAAAAMGRTGEFGTLTKGTQADLLVLDADPRDDVGNIRRIRHVIRAGRVHR